MKHIFKGITAPSFAPRGIGNHYVNIANGDMYISKGISAPSDWVLLVGDTDIFVKIAATDTTAGYLKDKIVAGTAITITEQNIGGNETLVIEASGSAFTDEKVKVSAADTTPGYLNSELIVSNGINSTSPLEKAITNPGADEKLSIQFDQTKISVTSSQVSDFTEAAQDAAGSLFLDTASIDFTYNDALNQITASVLPGGVDHNSLLNWVANKHVDHSVVSLIPGTGISPTGLGDITVSRTINLANTSVTASSYGSASQVGTFTVNAQGQLTAAANAAISITSGSVTDFTEAAQDAIAATLTNTSTINFTYNDPANQIAADVNNASITNTKLATMPAGTIKGNNTGATSAPLDLTGTQTTAMLDIFTSTLKGLAPASGGGTVNFLRADGTWATPPNSGGTVTSVGLALPSIFTVSGSPVTSSGTLTGSFNTQSANLVFAGPTTGVPAVPTFRALVAADIPALSYLTSIATGTGLTGGPITGSGTISIANTSVVSGSYGSDSQVGTFTVNAQGQLTAAASVSISILSSQVSDFNEAVDDRVAALIIGGTNVTTSYNDAGNALTINATAQTGTGLKMKAGTVAAGSFSGSPKKTTITFGTPFASTAYAIVITGTDSRSFTWESKAVGSFVINTNANTALTGNVDWQAVAIGESN